MASLEGWTTGTMLNHKNTDHGQLLRCLPKATRRLGHSMGTSSTSAWSVGLAGVVKAMRGQRRQKPWLIQSNVRLRCVERESNSEAKSISSVITHLQLEPSAV